MPVTDGDLMASRYQLLEEIGSGSFGVVYKAIEKATGRVVAVKHIDLEASQDDIAEIQQEIQVLSACSSSFVTQYLGSFIKGYKLWIMMEYLAGGSCLDLLKPGTFSEAHIAIICRELLLGLDYLHEEGKIHRDIKAANILLSGTGAVKIADFGVAAQLGNIKSIRNTFVGTPYWMAPEVIQQHGYDSKADLWSLGITAIEMAKGEPPNAHIHAMKVLFIIPKEPAPRLEGSQWSREFKEFINMCLVKDPDYRASAKDLLKCRFIRNAGKVEALQELVERKQLWDSERSSQRRSHPRLYEETMKNIEPQLEDAWSFETIKATSRIHKGPRHIESDFSTSEAPELEALQNLSINSSPHTSPIPFSHKNHGMTNASLDKRHSTAKITPQIDTTQVQHPQHQIKQDNYGVKIINNIHHHNNVTGNVIVHEDRRPESRHSLSATIRQKPSSDLRDNRLDRSFQDDSRVQIQAPKTVVSEEGLLGRMVFGNVVRGVLEDMHATSPMAEDRDTISNLANAWASMDALSPELEFKFVKQLVGRIKRQPKLQHILLPELKRTLQPASPIVKKQTLTVVPQRQLSIVRKSPTKAIPVPVNRITKSPQKRAIETSRPTTPSTPAGVPKRRTTNYASPPSIQVTPKNVHQHKRTQSNLSPTRPNYLRQSTNSGNVIPPLVLPGGHKRSQSIVAPVYQPPHTRLKQTQPELQPYQVQRQNVLQNSNMANISSKPMPPRVDVMKRAIIQQKSIEDIQMQDAWDDFPRPSSRDQQQQAHTNGGNPLGDVLYARWVDGLRTRWPQTAEGR